MFLKVTDYRGSLKIFSMCKSVYAEDGAKLHPPKIWLNQLAFAFLLEQIEELFLLQKLGSRKKTLFRTVFLAAGIRFKVIS